MWKKGLYLILIATMFTACSEYTKIQKSKDPAKKLSYANKLYDKGKYMKAEQLYEPLLPVYKGTKEFEDLYYNYAYCAYYLQDYIQAAFYFKNFVDNFPNSPRAEEMDYMQAYCYYKLSPRVELDQSNTEKAIAAMQNFIESHPYSDSLDAANKVIDLSRKKLEKKELHAAQLYYDLGFYKAAGITFANLMRNYPDSKSDDQYKYMVVKSYYVYAEKSIVQRQKQRYSKVVSEYLDFSDRYPQSKYLKEAQKYYASSQKNIKTLNNEQNTQELNQ